MSTTKLDSIKQGVSVIMAAFNINEAHLAGILHVSERSLNDWKKRGMKDLPPSAKRLVRLFAVVDYLQAKHKEIPEPSYKNLIENGRITIDPNDPEDGTTSLISYICAEPEATMWAPCVDEVVRDFVREQITETEQHRESHPSATNIHVIEKSAYDAVAKERDQAHAEITRLNQVIARKLSENDELGSEYTYVSVLRGELDAVIKERDEIKATIDQDHLDDMLRIQDAERKLEAVTKERDEAKVEIECLKESFRETIGAYIFLDRLDSGEIVSSGVCSTIEIATAQACGRFYTDRKGLGYVLREVNSRDRLTKERDEAMRLISTLDAEMRKCLPSPRMNGIASYSHEQKSIYAFREMISKWLLEEEE
jgi:hypothetical protein